MLVKSLPKLPQKRLLPRRFKKITKKIAKAAAPKAAPKKAAAKKASAKKAATKK